MGFSLIPKDDQYFADFDEGIAMVRKISRTWLEAVRSGRLDNQLALEIKVMETDLDDVTKRCLARLDSSFVTPIEREDIHTLAVSIDDVADILEAAANRIDIYGITAPTPEMIEFVEALDEMMGLLVGAVGALRSLKPADVRGATARIDVLEEKVDRTYREALRVLFARHPEAYDLVRWKEIYDLLERAADHGRHVARTLNHILVRHS